MKDSRNHRVQRYHGYLQLVQGVSGCCGLLDFGPCRTNPGIFGVGFADFVAQRSLR